MFSARVRLIAALLVVWIIWGSTYLAIRVALDSFPPLGMAGLRLTAAGALLLAFGWWRGETKLNPGQWRTCAGVGVLMFMLGNGSVMVAEKTVSSGVVAVMVGAVPLYAVAIGRLFGTAVSLRQWFSLILGLVGIVLLNGGAELSGQLGTAGMLTVGSLGWALGSVLAKRAAFASPTLASGAQLLSGGLALGISALVAGEGLPQSASGASIAALVYLFVFGSIVAFSAYAYLLRHASIALATSYGYVNPVVAVALGSLFLGERLDTMGWWGLVTIVVSVVLLTAKMPLRGPGSPIPGSPTNGGQKESNHALPVPTGYFPGSPFPSVHGHPHPRVAEIRD